MLQATDRAALIAECLAVRGSAVRRCSAQQSDAAAACFHFAFYLHGAPEVNPSAVFKSHTKSPDVETIGTQISLADGSGKPQQ